MWRDEWSKSVKTSRILTIWTSKVSKTTRVGPLLEVEVLQKCQNASCFNDLQVKTVKTHIRETLGHKKLLSRAREKTFARILNITRTVFAIATLYYRSITMCHLQEPASWLKKNADTAKAESAAPACFLTSCCPCNSMQVG